MKKLTQDEKEHIEITKHLHALRKLIGTPFSLNVNGGGPLLILNPGDPIPPDEDSPVVGPKIHNDTPAGKGKTVIMA
jgi:hypothetical protein